MAIATASAAMETQTLIQSESRIQHSYQEVRMSSEQRTEQHSEVRTEKRSEKVKKKKSLRRHKDEGTISVSKSSEKLHKKMKAVADGESNPKCEMCTRPVYAMERVKAEKRVWHKECFRCVQCNKQLTESNPKCEMCTRPAYVMEREKAEKRVWHKECFRCVQSNKQLTVETYQSDHTTLYCKPHFKQLFEPKPVEGEDEADAAPVKKHQMIICESNPVELPPDVVRASDKPDLGIEELTQLDLKSRFEVFEKGAVKAEEPKPEPRRREKSQTLLSKLAKFKAKGMDIGVSDEYLNGVPVEASDSEVEGDEDDEDALLRKSYKQTLKQEQPVSFCNMSEIVGKFEKGSDSSSERHRERKQEIQNIRSRLFMPVSFCNMSDIVGKFGKGSDSSSERHRERKQEIQNIRSRLFMGKQAKIKEMYEQSVMQSEQGVTSSDKISLELDAEKAKLIKERFEKGEIFNDENQPPKPREIDDKTLFNDGIAKKSRSIFLELDANAKSSGPLSPPPQEPPKRKEMQFVPKDVVRAEDKVDDVHIETRDISDRFKFFETYKPETQRKEFRMTPPRQVQRAKSPSPEVYHEPSVARGGGAVDTDFALDRHTASRMIDVFRQMEQTQHSNNDQGPKPLKCFTPPPPGESNHHGDTSSEEEYTDEEYETDSEEERRQAYLQAREGDEALKQAQQLARTKSFRDRFENWQESPRSPAATAPADIRQQFEDDDGESQLETAKSLREKFENMKVQSSTVTKTAAPKVNRFV